MIYMNPFVVQEYEQTAIDNGYVRAVVPSIVRGEEKSAYIMKNIDALDYSPGAERLKNEIVGRSSLKNSSKISPSAPAFFADIDEREIKALMESGDVVSIDRIDDKPQANFSAYYDRVVDDGITILNSEIIPWGKQAINADDSITVANNNFYIVDAPYDSPALSREFNFTLSAQAHPTPGFDHPASVLSLAVAKANFSRIRGINPGQPIVHFGVESNWGVIDTENLFFNIATAANFAEQLDQFSTLNLSISGTADSSENNIFNHNSLIGRVIKRASGRLMVAQAAGNFNKNACLQAFNYNGSSADPMDGILVVGGTDRNGSRYPRTPNTNFNYATEDASNYGPCVEVWAPGSEMTTTLADGTIGSYTGTSFAAPLVAAIAARYGDATTRPIERETYIRKALQATGKYDEVPGFGLPIMQVRYVDPSTFSIPKRLPITAAYSITSTANLNALFDQKFYDGVFWNAGSNWGSIVLDLGSIRELSGVRMMMRSSAQNGEPINFAVHGGNSISVTAPGVGQIPANPIAYWTFYDQYDLTPFYISLSGNYRYVMIEAENFGSWLAYSEVEVYGK